MANSHRPLAETLFVLVASQLTATATCTSNETVTASYSMESLFDSAKGVHLGGSILAMAAIAVGIVTVALGYRLFRATLFVVGFTFGGTGIAMAVEKVFAAEEWVATASWVAFVVGGVLCGFLVLCLTSLGIFAVGVMAGVMLAMVLSDAFGYMVYPDSPGTVLALLCVVLGLLGGYLALKLEKPVLIVATSLFGAGILVWGIGYFAGDFPTFSDLKRVATQDADGDWHYSIPGAWCAYLAGFAVLFVLSMCIQFRKTSRHGHYHKQYARQHRTRSAPYIRA
ncbi:hypothetical protein KRP22_003170 [Phytophthora ramorum]|uniref:Transmembrane protein 198 n=1 Tax=Phytophthora ramorum TaxID=164328 RepID=H3GI92_PHYRM|nr:hypothetical protein KRP23_10243 [Phytophthora ramorum]KAH7503773.1 hypothetical protein KRP22_6821 [Phytophthora ramorum]